MKRFFELFISALAALSSLATLIAFSFKWDLSNVSTLCSVGLFGIIIFWGVVYALYMSRTKKKIELELNASLKVSIYTGDIFASKGVVVIPVNEYFDTIVDNIIISHSSIHGKFIDKYFTDRLGELDGKISQALANVPGGTNNPNRQSGKKMKYPLGTCISVRDGENEYVLFALTHFDNNNVALVKSEEVHGIIIKLFEYLDAHSNNRPVYMPVFGTSLSRLKKKPQRMLVYILDTLHFMREIAMPAGLNIVCYKASDYNLNKVESYFENYLK